MSLSKKIAVAILSVFLLATVVLFAVQHTLYSRNFKAILAEVEQSVIQLKRQDAKDILREVKIATEGSLQRGEHTQFLRFARQQAELEEIKAFSFYGKTGKLELSSDAKRVGEQLDPRLWTQAKSSQGIFISEDTETLSFYCPLYVDADMRRLYPDSKLGEVYGVLHLEFSKDTINRMLAEAQASYQSNARRTSGIVVLSMIVAALVVTAVIVVVTRRITRPITDVIAGLTAGANEVNDAARNILLASHRFSQGAAEQASSIADSSRALSEMASASRENADNATEADQFMVQVLQTIVEADAVMKESSESMTGISEAGNKISTIIKVIEEIAFQTNLLALNAAVEAARAGEHGKGFAVVAGEVRGLAQRSAQAAGDTSALIQETIDRVSRGAELNHTTTKCFEKIGDSARQAGQLVTRITQASGNQAHGVDQVSSAVTQMDKITQANAVGAEQSAQSAEGLSAQAQNVHGMVDKLACLVGGDAAIGNASPDAARTPLERNRH
ncbi:MAG: hypothetical protein JXQ73_19560 [Phycisphaerae bacterium]|nr:hypothetical protein [Phycisphaerae bacterium]